LIRNVKCHLLQGVHRRDPVDERDEQVEAWAQGGLVLAEAFDDQGGLLRDDAGEWGERKARFRMRLMARARPHRVEFLSPWSPSRVSHEEKGREKEREKETRWRRRRVGWVLRRFDDGSKPRRVSVSLSPDAIVDRAQGAGVRKWTASTTAAGGWWVVAATKVAGRGRRRRNGTTTLAGCGECGRAGAGDAARSGHSCSTG
jgi:hypothetical protein